MTIGWTNQAQYTFNVKILFWINIDKTKLEYSTEGMLKGKKGHVIPLIYSISYVLELF